MTIEPGEQTRLAMRNFTVSGEPMPMALVQALIVIKRAAAGVNAADPAVGLDAEVAEAIVAACDELGDDPDPELFPIDVFQTGSGTSTNMNVNEVLAELAGRHLDRAGGANRTVHPNDHVNASQSSNDTVPSALRIAALRGIDDDLLPALRGLQAELDRKAEALADVVKAGRTHMMDATPVTLGQELGGYAAQIGDAIERIEATRHRLGRLPLGGTATGTGINAPAGFGRAMAAALAASTGLPLTEAPDHFAVQGGQDAIVEASGQVRAAAVAMYKIASDIRLLASGPRTGLGELVLVELQKGSSIMPGKVNPVICEVVTQVAGQVIGNDAAIAFAGTQGQLELNTYLPLMARNLLSSIAFLAGAARSFASLTVATMEADRARTRSHAEATAAVATALTPLLGYDTAADVVAEAGRSGRTVREVVRARGLLDEATLDERLDLVALTRP